MLLAGRAFRLRIADCGLQIGGAARGHCGRCVATTDRGKGPCSVSRHSAQLRIITIEPLISFMTRIGKNSFLPLEGSLRRSKPKHA